MLSVSKKLFNTVLSDNVFQCYQLSQRLICSSPSNLKSIQNVQDPAANSECGIPLGIMGQPTCHTHPHMVGPGKLVPGLTATEFKNRRTEFMRNLIASTPKQNKSKGHTVIIPSAAKQYMSDKIPYIFRQNSDFFYLTGCLEPDSVLVMTSLPNCENIHKTLLFIRGKDKHSELWDGPRTSFDDATQMFKMDIAMPYVDLKSFLRSHLSDNRLDHLWYSPSSPLHQQVDNIVRNIINTEKSYPPVCPRRILASQRLIKSTAEARLILDACKTGSSSINFAMSCTKPGISEHDVHATIDFMSRRAGAEHLAFPPVVGGGHRATAIHYIHDNQMLSNGELLLVDAGCQKFCYNSDITRTWPVSGKYTEAQAVLYDIIFSVQNALFNIIREQRPTLDRLFDNMCTILGSYLREEGIIPKSTSDNELNALAYKYCPHHVSHYLGLDVHDTPSVMRNIPIIPGMVITVEPGIYVSPNDDSVPEEFKGIGIRIEDDVLITQGNPMILTESCIKDRQEIEKIVGTRDLPQ